MSDATPTNEELVHALYFAQGPLEKIKASGPILVALTERDALRAEVASRDMAMRLAKEAVEHNARRAERAEAELAEARARIGILTVAVERAERMFRWYGDLHAAKEQTPENAAKTKRNDDEADAMRAALENEQPR